MLYQEIMNLHKYLQSYVDASPCIELHINSSKDSVMVLDALAAISQQVRILEAGIVPVHLRPAEDVEAGGTVVCFADYKKTKAKGA